jgi:Lon protease-like protein
MELPDDIQIPDILPVMTLKETVLFPHAVLPLFIFEQRYRTMLDEVLQSHRLFAIFNERDDDDGQEEQPETIGTVGIVRAAHKNPDGTSNLALQGVMRVRLLEIVQESPYRMIRVSPCTNPEEDEDPSERMELRKHILSILDEEPELTSGLPEEYVDFIKSLEKPAPFIDVAIQSICHCTAVKQRLSGNPFADGSLRDLRAIPPERAKQTQAVPAAPGKDPRGRDRPELGGRDSVLNIYMPRRSCGLKHAH